MTFTLKDAISWIVIFALIASLIRQDVQTTRLRNELATADMQCWQRYRHNTSDVNDLYQQCSDLKWDAIYLAGRVHVLETKHAASPETLRQGLPSDLAGAAPHMPQGETGSSLDRESYRRGNSLIGVGNSPVAPHISPAHAAATANTVSPDSAPRRSGG